MFAFNVEHYREEGGKSWKQNWIQGEVVGRPRENLLNI